MIRDSNPFGFSVPTNSEEDADRLLDAEGETLSPEPASATVKVWQTLAAVAAPVHILHHGTETEPQVYFPQELIGGVCPWIKGREEETVWRAAAAACGTERVHIVWHVRNNHLYYLAIKSEEMASHHNSWCPFAALLPGMEDTPPSPVCYTYYANGSAAMMVVTEDGLDIYRGITLLARAKAERSSRELNNAPIIELTPDRVARLKPHPWHSVSLFEERAKRILALTLVVSALGFTGLAFLVWLYAALSFIGSRIAYFQHEQKGDRAGLMKSFDTLRIDPMHQQLADFTKVNDGLIALDGLLVTYRIHNGQPYWRAIVNSSLSADSMKNLNADTLEPGTNDKMILGQGMDSGTPPASTSPSAKGNK